MNNIRCFGNNFILDTMNTSYAFGVLPTGQLEHYYYGKKIHISTESDFEVMKEKHEHQGGNLISYDEEHTNICLEDICLEASFSGKGDIREPLISITYENGSSLNDFVYMSHSLTTGKDTMLTLPASYDDTEACEHLIVILTDKNTKVQLELHYYVFYDCDTITRRSKIINASEQVITVNRALSMQFDFSDKDFIFSTFNGAWTREMQRHNTNISSGKIINSTYAGVSSSRANPFVMLSKPGCTEDSGEVYAFNLIYSGNHYEAVEVSSFDKTRISTGINPEGFTYLLGAGEFFETPEAIMTYSGCGFNAMSQNMHKFVREHIVRGEWKEKVRPVLLNSWEANYFDINENKLVKLAKAAKDVGIELFVMDDGWFGERNDDTSSLGDWDVNPAKLPNGLKGICSKINALGLDFGIWVEPEMINTKSKLYDKHPNWALATPDTNHSEGRHQRLLDLANEEVQNFIIDKMSEVFSSANIKYVKWDMNRIFSDYYSPSLPAAKQGEAAHRYYIGLYRCMKELTDRFPHILFEGCASGGNRFDLGILCYFPQIWASDNTDALSRADIQTGYSYGYPMSTVSAHVSSCPNHQTLRVTPLDTRFNIAAFGVLGYECNLCDMKSDDLNIIKNQISLYKMWRKTLQFGNFYRGRNDNITEWTCVSTDCEKAVGVLFQKLVTPNSPYEYFRATGLNPTLRYHFYNYKMKHDIKGFGDLINTVAPVHIKQDSLAHNMISHFVKMDGEVDSFICYGDVLTNHGVKLSQGFAGTGYNDKTRYFQDFSSRMYFMEKTDN